MLLGLFLSSWACFSTCPILILKLLFTLLAEIVKSPIRPVFGQNKISTLSPEVTYF